MCEAVSDEFIQGTSGVTSLQIEDIFQNPITHEPQMEIGSIFQELLYLFSPV